MNKETDNTSKISDSTCKVAPETNAISTDAPEQAPKPTLKQAVCSIVEILEQMKKQMTPDGKDYLSLKIACFSSGHIDISLYSGKAQESWSLPSDCAENLEDFRSFEISEEKIASFLKAKIKTPEQILKAAIEEKGSELAELKAKLAWLEEKEAGNED